MLTKIKLVSFAKESGSKFKYLSVLSKATLTKFKGYKIVFLK